jgi:predicted amidohydrolase
MLDILIMDGIIIDPSDGRIERGDIGIRGGKIVDLSEHPERRAEIVVNASGCYVTPGLIDFHAHLYTDGTERGVYPESTYFPNGVTTAIDGGSAGVANYPIFHNTVMATSKVRIFADLNICSLGLGTVTYQENIDPGTVNVEKIKYFFDKYGDRLQALKLRQSQNISREFRLEPLKLAREIADHLGVYLVVHVTDSPGEVRDTLDLLRPGDVFCHVFHGKGKTILGDDGKVLQEVWAARKRGVLFDAAHGGNQFSNGTAKAALNEGFLPDFISSDISLKTMYNPPLFSMGMVLSKFFNMGLDFPELIRLTTYIPAHKLGLEQEIGALKPGYCADVAIFKLIEKETCFEDSHGAFFYGDKLIKTQMTIREGVCVFRQIDF